MPGEVSAIKFRSIVSAGWSMTVIPQDCSHTRISGLLCQEVLSGLAGPKALVLGTVIPNGRSDTEQLQESGAAKKNAPTI